MDATAMTGNDTRILEYAEAELSRAGPIEPVLDEIRRDGLPLVGSAASLKPRTVRGLNHRSNKNLHTTNHRWESGNAT
jgi:hypothetical protein